MPGRVNRILVCSVFLGALAFATTVPDAADGRVADAGAPQFERDVLPILTAHCLKCHGREARKASLDLRTMVLLSHGGENGQVVQAGSTEESPLFERIRDRSMPPKGELPLTDAQIDVVRRWIESGASAAENPAGDGEVLTPGLWQHLLAGG